MPGGDRTGPMGMGPMTGRGAGYCNGGNMPGFGNAGFGFGRGFKRGRGFGRGFGFRRFGYIPQQTTIQPQIKERDYLQQELKSIEQEEKILQKEKEELKKRIEGLKQQG